MEIIETPVFTGELKTNGVPDDDYRGLQIQLVANPGSGDLIRGSGGARRLSRRFDMEKELFEKLYKSAKQASAISKGKAKPSRRYTFKPEDIAQMRKKLNLSQNQFADLLRVPPSTLRNWEQGRTRPDAPAQTLLLIVNKRPQILSEVSDTSPAKVGAVKLKRAAKK